MEHEPRVRIPEPTPRVPPVYGQLRQTFDDTPAPFGCARPYWIDAQGVKHYKAECLGR